ncbi:MAG: hypothetical protein WAU86_21985 [Oricola sp.]
MRRTGTAIAFLLTAAGAQAQSGDPASGEDVFVSDCVRCHATAGRIVRKIDGATPEEKTEWLNAFLPGHYLRDTDGRTDLIAYLLSL